MRYTIVHIQSTADVEFVYEATGGEIIYDDEEVWTRGLRWYYNGVKTGNEPWCLVNIGDIIILKDVVNRELTWYDCEVHDHCPR